MGLVDLVTPAKATDTSSQQNELNRLRATGERWLANGFDGVGQAGTVSGDKIREYSGDSFSHSFKGYLNARKQFGHKFGEKLELARTGSANDLSGEVGLVGEVPDSGDNFMVCEIFDLATGDCLLLRQPFRKRLLSRRRSGPVEVITSVEPLQYVATDPRAAQMAERLKPIATDAIAQRADEFSGFPVKLIMTFTQSHDDGLWYGHLRNIGKDIKGAPPTGIRGAPGIIVWNDGAPISDAALLQWLDQQLTAVLDNLRRAG